MNVTFSRRADYAIRAVLDIARAYGTGRRKTREIAAEMNIPPNYLSQILAVLVRHGILTAVAGQEGGYELARPPAAIRMLDVLEVFEGAPRIQRCLLRGIPCGSDGTCAVHDSWTDAQEALAARLADVTFEELAERDRALRAGRTG